MLTFMDCFSPVRHIDTENSSYEKNYILGQMIIFFSCTSCNCFAIFAVFHYRIFSVLFCVGKSLEMSIYIGTHLPIEQIKYVTSIKRLTTTLCQSLLKNCITLKASFHVLHSCCGQLDTDVLFAGIYRNQNMSQFPAYACQQGVWSRQVTESLLVWGQFISSLSPSFQNSHNGNDDILHLCWCLMQHESFLAISDLHFSSFYD